MIEAHRIFDVETDILAPVLKLTQEQEKCGKCSVDAGLRVVGQEQDGCLLYAWAAQASSFNNSTDEEEGPRVTHVGLYNPANKTNKTLFIHENLVNIVNCSVSQEHTFLGFVTLEQTYTSEGYGRRQKQECYRAYLAEVPVSPDVQYRVFYLNLERPQYLRLQFLYGAYHGQVALREAHLLVFLHRESIGLYHIPMARVGADGVIVSGEPKKEQIFQKRFVWSQWDATHQRLYIVQFRRQPKTARSSKATPGSAYRAFLTGYQFTETTANQFMLDVPLDLPIPYWKTSGQRSHYEDPAPHSCIPDSSINMYVVGRNNGTICVCLQHPPTSKTVSPIIKAGTETLTSPTEEREDEHTVQYSVVMLHHGQTMACSGLRVAYGVMRRARLLFAPLGDYLLVHLPGHFTHLLNVGVELEPCHHILWHKMSDSKAGPVGTGTQRNAEVGEGGSLLPLLWDRQAGGLSSDTLVYDPHTQKGYRLSISHDILVESFTISETLTTKLAILHYAVIHQRDLLLTRTLFESLLTDTACPNLGGILEEFLVGSTYVALRGQMEQYVMRLMPFTCDHTFRDQTEMDSDGKRLCSITYASVGPVMFSNLSKVKGDHQVTEMWNNLVAAAGNKPTRFTSKLVQPQLETGDGEHKEFVKVNLDEVPSQQNLTATKSWGGADSASSDSPTVSPAPSRTKVVLGRPPAFLSASPSTPDHRQEQLMSLTSDLLVAHLKRFLKRDSRSKLRCLASEYIKCQMQQSRQLAYILCSLLVPEDTPAVRSLAEPGSPEEHALFQCMKRYHLALGQQAFPQPTGFPLYLACLAYRCLPFSVFKQYVNSQVVRITQELMEKLIYDVPDNTETVPRKMTVLRMLPPSVAIACARHWNHPIIRRFLATRYTEACLNDGEKEEFSPVYHSHHTEIPAEPTPKAQHGFGFAPLTALIDAVERKVSRRASRSKNPTVPVDRRLLEDIGLAELCVGGCSHDDILTFG